MANKDKRVAVATDTDKVAQVRRPRGRPELTPSRVQIDAICNALKAGGYLETAVSFSGVSKQTFYKWMRRGVKEKSGPFRDLLDAVKSATANAEMRYLAVIGKAGITQWQAAAWILERRWPVKFGRRVVLEDPKPTGRSSKL